MINENDHTLIHKYIDKELNPLEVKAFEKRLLVEEDLAKELEIAKSMTNFVKHRSSIKVMEEAIKAEAEKNKTKERKVLWYKNKYLQIAASILFLVLATFLIKNLTSSSDSLYDKYAIHSPLSGELGDNETIDLAKAINFFNNSDYKLALVEFEKSSLEDAPNFKLANGICYLELDQFQNAKNEFDYLVQNNVLYKGKALWYLALTALKEEKITDCKTYLKRIDKESYYYPNAMELLDSLSDE